MKFLNHIPLWVLTGILYGLSWPIFEGVNLSFLAWFAFVPLFLFLEKNQHNFRKSMVGSTLAMVIFGFFCAGWLFNYPRAGAEVATVFFINEFWFIIPFPPFF